MTTVPDIHVDAVTAVPLITNISPDPAGVGDQIQITGQNFPYGDLTVYFPGPNGTKIPALASYRSSNAYVVVVPFGAKSGPLIIQSGVLRSNTFTFTRLPNVRIHADRKDIAAGESVQLHADLLGDNSPQTIVWTSEQGTISNSGTYVAPPNLSSDIFAHVSGCLKNTTICDTLLLGIRPFRIDPIAPVVPMGDTIHLEALVGNSLVVPTWQIEAGGGTLD